MQLLLSQIAELVPKQTVEGQLGTTMDHLKSSHAFLQLATILGQSTVRMVPGRSATKATAMGLVVTNSDLHQADPLKCLTTSELASIAAATAVGSEGLLTS